MIIRNRVSFSALQRAEIAEIECQARLTAHGLGFSALQRAEIAEIQQGIGGQWRLVSFSALQRAEIAEIGLSCNVEIGMLIVSVLFNEPKLLKFIKR